MTKRLIQFEQYGTQLTPKKRIKMNEDLDSPRLVKKSSSIVNGTDFCVLKDLRRKNSFKINTSLFNPVSCPQVSIFEPTMDLFSGFANSNSKTIVNSNQKLYSIPDGLFKRSSSKIVRNNNNMRQPQDDTIQQEDYEQDMQNLMRFNRKFTDIDQLDNIEEIQGENLSLYRHNSTFNPTVQREIMKYGDNVYIQQIMALKRSEGKVNRNSSNKENCINEGNMQLSSASNNKQKQSNQNKFYKQNTFEDQGQRLLQDYQIRNNLKHHNAHHENLICLNKIERIFYYIKKVEFIDEKASEEQNQQQLGLCRLQVNLSNKDQNYSLLRLYQSWVEIDSIYMIFQLGEFSLQGKNEDSIRLPQYEIWSLINGCCKSLSYLHSQQYYHLNIKPGNIIKCRKSFKLADFYGKIDYLVKKLRKQQQEEYWNIHFPFCAPQIIKYLNLLEGIDFSKCDVYSLGMCILTNILSLGSNVYKNNLEFKKLRKTINRSLKGYSPSLRRLLLRMISSDPQKRPSIQQLIITPDFLQNHRLFDSGQIKIPSVKRKLSL